MHINMHILCQYAKIYKYIYIQIYKYTNIYIYIYMIFVEKTHHFEFLSRWLQKLIFFQLLMKL